MRYTYEFKKECVELYRQGKWPETPEGIDSRNFHKTVRQWYRLEEIHGPEIFKHKSNIKWTADEKLDIVSKVLAGNSIKSVAIQYAINPGQLYSWVNKYKEYGYNGLENKKRGKKSKSSKMKESPEKKPKELTQSEREEFIKLKSEVEYLKAENEIIKKEIALREKKCAAQLKAKKQR